MEAKLILEYDDERTAKAVAEAVSPDNVKTPVGISVRTRLEGREVSTVINCGKSIKTFIATVDDLLSYVRVAERSLEALGSS